MRGRSKHTRLDALPTSKNGTSIDCDGMRKRQTLLERGYFGRIVKHHFELLALMNGAAARGAAEGTNASCVVLALPQEVVRDSRRVCAEEALRVADLVTKVRARAQHSNNLRTQRIKVRRP